MGKRKIVPDKVVDTRSEEEKQLSSFKVRMRNADLTEQEKRDLEALAAKLDEEGKEHEFSGIGKFYSIQFTGEDDYENFRLVGSNPKITAVPEEREVSISAPLGNAVRNLKVGETGVYTVADRNFKNQISFKLIAVAGTYQELTEKVKSLGNK